MLEGTKVRFLKEINDPPCEDHPALLYARAGECGIVLQAYDARPPGRKVYIAKTDTWPAEFAVYADEIEEIK